MKNVMDFAGSWKLSDEEAREVVSSLKGMWKKWKIS